MESKRLITKTNIAKTKKSQTTIASDVTSELDIKYQIHLCQKELQQHSNAIKTLETISSRQRTSKINMALADLYLKDRLSEAIVCYKEILRENPLALDVIKQLLQLGVKSQEITNLVTCSITNLTQLDWLTTWLKAQASMYTPETTDAINAFKKLLVKPNFRDNSDLQISLAESYYFNGDYRKASVVFRKCYQNDPICVRGMDAYAACLTKEHMTKELEVLATKMLARCESNDQSAEPWIVLAYFSFANARKDAKSDSKALYFAQKACLLSNNSVEALLLKGRIMAELKSQGDAVSYLIEAHNIAPYRFETLKSLTEAYISEGKRNQASAMAQQAFKTFGQTPRTLTVSVITFYDHRLMLFFRSSHNPILCLLILFYMLFSTSCMQKCHCRNRKSRAPRRMHEIRWRKRSGWIGVTCRQFICWLTCLLTRKITSVPSRRKLTSSS